jgi:putative membrane protein
MVANGKKAEPLHIILLVLFVVAYIISAIRPLDRLAWMGQMTPALLLVFLLVVTYRKFRFSTFVYVMAFLHALLLVYGAHFTYSQNPLFNQWKEQFDWERNYFDRVGHFAQGFVPAFLAKEFLLRGGYVKKSKMLTLIVILSCLGFSAAYELSEFAVVKIMDVPADAVMGTQGDAFDSLWDMIWALIGASLALFVFGPFHDSQMEKMRDPDGPLR